MRKLTAVAALLLFGVGLTPKASAALALKGSDTLEDVTKDVIALCPAAVAAGITYSGGGSGGGEAAMIAATPTQQISPMSRELSTTGSPVACDPTKGAQELLVGLDGIAIVGSNHLSGDSLEKTVSTADDCGDSIVGGAKVACDSTDPVIAPSHGCVLDTDGVTWVYIFKDWKDVLAMVYAGQNHGSAGLLIDNVCGASALATPFGCANDVSATPLSVPLDPRYNPAETTLASGAHRKVRNPVRVNCAGSIRQQLVDSWGLLFNDIGAASPLKCRDACCTRLKHAFRRGDLSGTTDTFVGLVGLIAIPNLTTTSANNFPDINAKATANPFCNAGEAPMNKGDSDYLDLDPIRRIADSASATGNRQGFEQVAEGFQAPANPNAACPDVRANPATAVLADYAWSNFANMGFDSIATATFPTYVTVQGAAMKARKGLGVVLTVEIPTNYQDDKIAYWWDGASVSHTPVVCDPGVFSPKLFGTNVICPNSTSVNGCLLPVNAATNNQNCLSDRAVPAAVGMNDARVHNLLVINSTGTFQKDNYLNPSLTLAAARQNRVVSGFFRLHTNQVTALGGTPTVAANPVGTCKAFTSTDQIGCLVRANPCSIGFAGREAVDLANTTVAFRIGQPGSSVVTNALPASKARIENLVTGFATPYPIARKLWVNAYKGLAAVAATTGTTGEAELLTCFGQGGASTSTIDTAIANRNFIPVPATLPDGTPITIGREKACPAVFP